MHQMGHTPFGDADPTRLQRLVHLGHTAVFTEAPLTNERNDIQTKLAHVSKAHRPSSSGRQRI
jgi:hypothetical protein